MRKVHPKVFLICKPQIDWGQVQSYLVEVGGQSWFKARANLYDSEGDGEDLIEFAGRLCYRSWEPGLNPNVKKIRKDQGEYFENLKRSGHGSVLEHANYTFVFHHCSRVFTHELCRHRAGTAISQESLRFVRLVDLSVWFPSALREEMDRDPSFEREAIHLVENMEAFQASAAERFGLDEEGASFPRKKEVTSALRRFAPDGLATTIVWTANIRTIRHVIEMRTDPGAEEEIRLVFDAVGKIMRQECPLLFSDYSVELVNDIGDWQTPYRKV